MTNAPSHKPADSIGVCITGMHRSGTSLTASWLERCGMPISDGRVLGADVGNPHGHFEDEDFYDLQRFAMDRMAGSWRVTDTTPLTFNDKELGEARKLASARMARFPLWGWKDPRSLYFFHEWKRLCPNLKCLILWRPCVEVVRSLRQRSASAWWRKSNFIDPFSAARVWAAHNRLALQLLREFPDDVMLVSVRALVEHDRAIIERCNEQWKLQLSYVPISEVRDGSLLQSAETVTSRWATRMVDASVLEQTLAARSYVPR